jgi:PKD repeat protein
MLQINERGFMMTKQALRGISVLLVMPCLLMAAEFDGSILLGSPTATSIKFNVLANQQGNAYIEYGTLPNQYTQKTSELPLSAGQSLNFNIDNLKENTRYYYRLRIQNTSEVNSVTSQEYTFQTARPSGSTFTFTIQADSHLDENSILAQYQQTLGNIRLDKPDFHIDLGDTFMIEKHSQAFTATVSMPLDQASVNARYAYERNNFGLMSHSSPLFLVNGNHDGELGWLANQSIQNVAIWGAKARQTYFLNPEPTSFYGGDSFVEPCCGHRASWYSWQWGDALFVVLDPYWNTVTKGKEGWALTLGDRQHQWLEKTLASSQSKYKFVFIHNLVGGLDGQMRGGIEAAPYYEWGGLNADGTRGFVQNRPNWSMPIHDMLVHYGVSAVFHGHDHLYAKQELDGIVYQEVPQPSAKNFSSGANLAKSYHYNSGTILSSSGHLRVTVSPQNVVANYVRSWIPSNENSLRQNAQIDDTWQIDSNVILPPLVANFTVTPTTANTEQEVVFHDDSSGNPTKWLWDFGDGQTSQIQNPTHRYITPNTYTVSLTISNAKVSKTISKTVSVSDKTAPVIRQFTIPSIMNSLSVPITVFDALDNKGVARYMLTQSKNTPSLTSSQWLSEVPKSYSFSSSGVKALYAWAKDEAGNISPPSMANITIDRTKPVVSKFVLPAKNNGLMIPISTLTASDNMAIAGYLVSESATLPNANSVDWLQEKPASYKTTTIGSKTLYLWVKDTAGNVSVAKTAKCVVSAPL